MNKLILAGLLLLSPAVLAEDAGPSLQLDAGVGVLEMASMPVVGVVDVPDAGEATVDAGVLVVIPSLDAPLDSAKGFYHAVTTGNGWLAAMFMLFFLVGALRIVGKRIHAMIPDDTKHPLLRPVEKAFFFIFDTKIGGWLLNWLSAVGGCLSSAAMAGHAVDAETWKVAVLASTGGTALIELKDDVMEWWDKKNAEKAAAKEAEAAAKVAVVAPDAPTPPAGNPTPEIPTTPENPVEPPKA